MDERAIWVFLVTGGQSFELVVPGSSRWNHDGTRSVFRAHCSTEQASMLKQHLEGRGVGVQAFVTGGEGGAEEHPAEAMWAWPTKQCPTCSWFDDGLAGGCGAGMVTLRDGGAASWDAVLIAERLLVPRFAEERASCPLSDPTRGQKR